MDQLAEPQNIAVAYPAIREAAVVARPNARWSERPLPVLVLQPDSAFDRDVMVAHYTGKVAKWCIPADILIAPELPHTATGRLLKSRIRELYCARHPATPSGDSHYWLRPLCRDADANVRAWHPLGSADQHREGHLVSIEPLRLRLARSDAIDRRSTLPRTGSA